MDSFLGIGIAELFFIAILALVILGPERLPGALREVAKVIRYVRNLTSELTNQFGDEMKAFDDLNPQKILNEVLEDPEEKKKAAAKAAAAKAAAAKPAAKTTPAAKPATHTPANTPTPPTPKPPPPTPAAHRAAAETTTDAAADTTPAAVETPKRVEQPTIKGTLVPPAKAAAAAGDDHAAKSDAPAGPGDASILPPQAGGATGAAKAESDRVPEKPAQPTTIAVNGTAASVDGSEA